VSGVRTYNLLADYETISGADASGSTIMAVRGRVWATRESQMATPTAVQWGLLIAPAQITTTSDYDPGGPGRYLDWMAREYYWLQAGTPAATSQLVPAGNVQSYDAVNVRSRRKLKEIGETLTLVTARPASGTTNIGLFWAFDVLLALP
jgi:hypothetical protein